MKNIKILAQWNNNYNYHIDQITDDNLTRIILRKIEDHPYGIISVIEFLTFSVSSDQFHLMNWDNLIRCSNYYGLPPEETCLTNDGNVPGYMATAVQKHLKPAATVRMAIDSSFVKQIICNSPKDCLVLPYKEENTTFVCRKGILADFYDINMVKEIYDSHKINGIDWNLVHKYCNQEIATFADSNNTGLFIERGAKGNTQTVITGLLLGYPIESTVAMFNRTYHAVNQISKCQAKAHFKTSNGPFIDSFGEKWMKQDNKVYASWQQEHIYYGGVI